MDIKHNINRWSSELGSSNDFSFDYCFNYFQSFRDNIAALVSPAQLELSCLQLGFYLASWGMYRGSAALSERSGKYLAPIIGAIVSTNQRIWQIDTHVYTEENLDIILRFWDELQNACPVTDLTMTDTLATKIMLGVFGCVPAYDTEFKKGCKANGITQSLGQRSLRQIGDFYKEYSAEIEAYRRPTLRFIDDQATDLFYSRAKLIDMALFMEAHKADSSQPDPTENAAKLPVLL